MKIIKIKDYYGNYQEVPVDDALYNEWRRLNNETQRVYRKEMYHRSCFPLKKQNAYRQKKTWKRLSASSSGGKKMPGSMRRSPS